MKRSIRITALFLAAALFLSCNAFAARKTGPEDVPGWVEQTVYISSGDDVLAATLTLPENVDTNGTESFPIVILVHGLSSNRFWNTDCAWAFADMGITSISVDMAGFGDSTGTSEEMTVTSLVQNLNDVLDYIEALRFVDKNNIFLLGKSMGGVASSLTAVDRLDEIAGVILWYPAFNIADAVKDGDFLGVPFDAENIPDTVTWYFHKYGREFIIECGELDTDSLLKELTCPVLMLSGDKDTIVPLISSMHAAEMMSNCTFEVIEAGHHWFVGKQVGEALSFTTSWLQEHLR